MIKLILIFTVKRVIQSERKKKLVVMNLCSFSGAIGYGINSLTLYSMELTLIFVFLFIV